jgi:hypothetical protein
LNLNDPQIGFVIKFVENGFNGFYIVRVDFKTNAAQRHRIHRHNRKRRLILKIVRDAFHIEAVLEDFYFVTIAKDGNCYKVFQNKQFYKFVN